MAYPGHALKAAQWLRSIPDSAIGNTIEFGQGVDGSYCFSKWDETYGAEPTESDLNTAVADQDCQDYIDENGRDALKTRRAMAKAALDAISTNETLIRGLALVVLDEINLIRGELSLSERTAAQLRTAIKNKIAAGNADT